MSEQPGRPSDQPDQQPGEVPPPHYGQYGSGYGEQPTEPGAATAPGAGAPSYGHPAPSYGQQPPPAQPGYGQQPPPPQPGYGQPGPQQGHPPAYGQPRGEMSPQDQRLWACLAHVSAIVAGLLLSGLSAYFLYLGAVGPLVLFFVFRERGAFVRRQVVEALNFQILLTIVYVALILLTVVTLFVGAILTVPLLVVVGVVGLVFEIIAAVKANQGVDYRYPVNWRLVK